MFNKKNTKKTNQNTEENTKTNDNSLKSWVTGKLGSFLLLSATGYALYKFGIIGKLASLLKLGKGKNKESE